MTTTPAYPPSHRARFSAARGVVFDLDGTLIDSRKDITRAVNHALQSVGRAPLCEELVSSYVGDGALALMARATGLEPNSVELAPLLERFRRHYTDHATVHTTLYPGVRETLETLATSTYAVGLCTNKPRVTTDRVLAELDLEKYFCITVCADDLPFKKPHPGPLLHIAARLGTRADELVMVGDGPQDIACGKAAGAATVGVTYGIRPKGEIASTSPDVLLDALNDLLPLLF